MWAVTPGGRPLSRYPGPESGTYALVLRARERRRLRVGRLGALDLASGYYVYVGSAFGPGGVAGRLRHHLGEAARPRWHIDYLRRCARIVEIWYSHDPRRREHVWARVVGELDGASVPLAGFGSSDCRCPAHLTAHRRRPALAEFRRALRLRVPNHHMTAVIRASRGRAIGWTPSGGGSRDGTRRHRGGPD